MPLYREVELGAGVTACPSRRGRSMFLVVEPGAGERIGAWPPADGDDTRHLRYNLDERALERLAGAVEEARG